MMLAAIRIADPRSLTEESVRIVCVADEFVLSGEDRLTIATSGSARALSRYAFTHGAARVRHDYDLRSDDP